MVPLWMRFIYLTVLNNPDENQKMLKRLVNFLVNQWSSVINKWLGNDNEIEILYEIGTTS